MSLPNITSLKLEKVAEDSYNFSIWKTSPLLGLPYAFASRI